ncbi:MAG: Sua5/YciO/YrdC/YwlC family protein [Armatimonadetes bacterium]|nr:Sua5/YciO/YrdC/YwlC family protein [Armatimonadota bacterium]
MSYYHLSFETAVDRQPRPVSMIRVHPTETAAPRKAVEVLRSGGLVVFPTEDGYYVGCAARNAEAVERLHRVTGAGPEHLVTFAVSRDQAEGLPGPAQIPRHPVALALMRDAGTPLVATWAPGAKPAPTAQHVVFIVGDKVDLILNGGRKIGSP